MVLLVVLLFIVFAALVLFIGGWLPVDVVGLMVLAALALTGLVSPEEAVAGFSSPAVITVWAMFILSAGLTRTDVAYRIGQPLQHFARGSEAVLVIALMTAASILSALINTTTVAAILMPATMDLARRSGRPPARLLMPMALGCLLGGPFTGISTPPNILATDALRAAGLAPFALFDFTPITAAVVVAGIVFTVTVGLRLLPKGDGSGGKKGTIESSYQVGSHIFSIELPPASPLVGRTLAESRLGSALYLTVVGLHRAGELILAPRAQDTLQAGIWSLSTVRRIRSAAFTAAAICGLRRADRKPPRSRAGWWSPAVSSGRDLPFWDGPWPKADCAATTGCMFWPSTRPPESAWRNSGVIIFRRETASSCRASPPPWSALPGRGSWRALRLWRKALANGPRAKN